MGGEAATPTSGAKGQNHAPRNRSAAQRRFRDRAEIGPLGAFLRLERGGIDLVIVPTERTEENAARGPESARSHIGRGVRLCSASARRRAVRRVALEVDGSDESFLS